MRRVCEKYRKVLKKYALLNTTSVKLFAFSVLFAFVNLILYMRLLHQFSKMEAENSFHESFRPNSNSHYIPDDGFSGCLVLKDDNDRLSEWLAYHWLVLPLKYLVVAVDPTGTTSPESILTKWNSSDMGMDIVLWNDIDFGHYIDETIDEMHKHRARQKHMYMDCQKYHKERNRTWIVFIDPDEYVTYNLITADDPKVLKADDTPEEFLKPEYISAAKNIRRNLTQVMLYDKTVFDFLQDEKNKHIWISEPCYLMPRLFFSAVESSPIQLAEADVTQFGFNTSRFNTLRYFHHAKRGRFNYNHFGKVILDLSRIKDRQMRVKNIHVPNRSCRYPPLKPYAAGILRVHHYIGSFDQYFSRNDVRRSKEKFDDFGSVSDGTDRQLQKWLKRFVDIVGVEKSLDLLEHAGIIDVGTTTIIEKEEYKVVPPPPLYYVYYHDSKGQISEKKVISRYTYKELVIEKGREFFIQNMTD